MYVKGLKNAYDDNNQDNATNSEFGSYEPELKRQSPKANDTAAGAGSSDSQDPAPRAVSPQEQLHQHLEVYALAQRFAVRGLPEQVLTAVAADVKARRELLGELVREVYGTKKKDEFLRGFVVGLVVNDWEAWSKEEGMRRLLMEGGEFVVDLVSRVKGF